MLAVGPEIARFLMNAITVLTIVIMVGGLVPKFWRKRRRAPAEGAAMAEDVREALPVTAHARASRRWSGPGDT
jgi:hypothetical protein